MNSLLKLVQDYGMLNIIIIKNMSENSGLENISIFFSHFYFFFLYFLFWKFRVKVRETRSCCHIPVTSDDMITSHEVTEKNIEDSGQMTL